MAFIKDLYHDEIRSGYLVTSDIKKVWNKQLELWQEVDRICRKHNITYWAAYGTLLGAARHGGFIPWDDDFDLNMMRPDFNRFTEIVSDELRGGIFETGVNISSAFRISHSQTTLLDSKDLRNAEKPVGLMIEIFPLDITFDGTQEAYFATNAINELMGTVYNFPAIVEHVQSGGKTVNAWHIIEEFNAISDKYKQFEYLKIFSEGVFDSSSNVAWIEDTAKNLNDSPAHKKDWFRETVYLPFESIELPAPIDYEKILTSYYGDWRTPVQDKRRRLGLVHSADIPYKDFLAQINADFYLPKK